MQINAASDLDSSLEALLKRVLEQRRNLARKKLRFFLFCYGY